MNTKREWAVITGAGTGIGRALAIQLAGKGWPVLGVGRREEPLRETMSAHPDRIRIVVADVSSDLDRRAYIPLEIPKEDQVGILVHNAAMLLPVMPLKDMDRVAWRTHMATNLDGPLFLTRALLPRMTRGSRILHVSSGAAHEAYRGWGAYCTSKAALNMVYRVLALELEPYGIRVGSVRPGVVDTPMQDQVREAPESVFPDLPRFSALKENGDLQSPERVARFLAWLLTETEDEEFSAREWDIGDSHQCPLD